jgi:hypothetical protein
MRDPSGYGQMLTGVDSSGGAARRPGEGAPPWPRSPRTSSARSIKPTRAVRRRSSSSMLWLLPSSWDNWVGLFEENGYAGVTPSWPDDPETVEEARANPDVFAKKTLKHVADHTAKVIDQLEARRDGPFDGRPAHLHDRRPGAVSRFGRHRPGAVPRRPAPAALGSEVGEPGAAESALAEAARSPSRSTSSSTDGPTRSTTRRRGTYTTRTTWPPPGWP